MNQKEVRQLAPGIYRLHWLSGGESIAAVGVNPNGGRWLAPTNWCRTPDSEACTPPLAPSRESGACAMNDPDWLDLFDAAALIALVLFVMYTVDSARF